MGLTTEWGSPDMGSTGRSFSSGTLNPNACPGKLFDGPNLWYSRCESLSSLPPPGRPSTPYSLLGNASWLRGVQP
ncbi:hypothetical protein DIPPA_18075 [Diplonema papillatum]|nr:hypothetical protein DIPPA_18075 [Diplonema papillatum]